MHHEKNASIIEELTQLLQKGNAHVSLDDALKDIPFDILGKIPEKLPYSIWQLASHICIAQWDILQFCKDPGHVSPRWPEEYWPEETAPKSNDAWKDCLQQIKNDRSSFIELMQQSSDHLFTPFVHGTGQSIFRETLLIADHNSYHAGEIIVLRRLLGNWHSE